MVARLLAAVLVAVVGTGAGVYYAFSPDGSAEHQTGCSLAVSEGSCCAAKLAQAKSGCCSPSADTCPLAGESEATSTDALAACSGGLASCSLAAPMSSDALAACTGGLTTGLKTKKAGGFCCSE